MNSTGAERLCWRNLCHESVMGQNKIMCIVITEINRNNGPRNVLRPFPHGLLYYFVHKSQNISIYYRMWLVPHLNKEGNRGWHVHRNGNAGSVMTVHGEGCRTNSILSRAQKWKKEPSPVPVSMDLQGTEAKRNLKSTETQGWIKSPGIWNKVKLHYNILK